MILTPCPYDPTKQSAWREHAEVQPLRFIDRELLPLLAHTIREFAPFVKAQAEDLVFLPSATVGLNTVINAEARSVWSRACPVPRGSVEEKEREREREREGESERRQRRRDRERGDREGETEREESEGDVCC